LRRRQHVAQLAVLHAVRRDPPLGASGAAWRIITDPGDAGAARREGASGGSLPGRSASTRSARFTLRFTLR
jgi:hypothetical protein